MNQSSEHLLAEFARARAEEPFRELVRRHLPLVYSTALRVANGDQHLAEDVAQTVFTDLARKASAIPSGTILAGWLHQHAWFTASKMIRSERRRQAREQETAAMLSELPDSPDTNLAELRPVLDEALTGLKPDERDALVLRYFEQVDLRQIGQTLGVSEDAAQKRVARALEKLRSLLLDRGVTISIAALTAFLSSQSLAAPSHLAASVSAGALAVAASGGVGILALLTSFKGKIAVGTGLAAAVTAPLIWQHRAIESLRAENARFMDVISSNDWLRAENDRLRRFTLSDADRDDLNRRFLELQRLRGEVTLLRQQQRASTLSTNAPAETESAEPDPAEQVAQVSVQVNVAELTHERMADLLTKGFPAVPNPGNFTTVLDASQADAVFQLLEQSEGVDLLSAPRVTTLDRRKAEITVSDDLHLPGGEIVPLGLNVGVLPQVQQDKTTVDLAADLTLTEFLGWANDQQNIPRLRTRSVKHDALLSSGQVLFLGVSVNKQEGEQSEPKLVIYALRSTVINPADPQPIPAAPY